MNDKLENGIMEDALTGLLQKYGIEVNERFSLCFSRSTVDATHLLPGYEFINSTPDARNVPLLSWRVQRSFLELRKIVEEEVVEEICLLKFSFNSSLDKWSLPYLIYREMDLCEFITGGKIKSVFAVLENEKYVNIIAKLNTNVLCSFEINLQLPHGAESQEKHEIIGRRGIACDRVVDTQVSQHSIYCFKREKNECYTDTDFELFEFSPKQREQIRGAFEVYRNPDLRFKWMDQHSHLIKVIEAVFISGQRRQKMNILQNNIYESN